MLLALVLKELVDGSSGEGVCCINGTTKRANIKLLQGLDVLWSSVDWSTYECGLGIDLASPVNLELSG